MRPALLPLLAVVACTPSDPPPGALVDLPITSENTGSSYDVKVFTPDAIDDLSTATVMYVFDGTENEKATLNALKDALDAGATAPVLVLVPGSNRVRDFTPTENERGTNGGGQAAFIRFVVDELAPRVEGEDGPGGSPERRITYGHSLGGLLSATFWYDHPFASRAGISSPSMWWDGGLFFEKWDDPPTNTGPIVVSAGEEEPMGMVPYTADFSEAMEALHGIDVTYEVSKGKTHQENFEAGLVQTYAELL